MEREESTREKLLLLVDDNEMTLELLKELFEAKGISVMSHSSPFDALQAVSGTSGIVGIVSDHEMPDMDGIEFLRRAAALKPDLPAVILSGVDRPKRAPEHLVWFKKSPSMTCVIAAIVQHLGLT